MLLAHSMGSKISYYFLRWVLWNELEENVRKCITFVPAIAKAESSTSPGSISNGSSKSLAGSLGLATKSNPNVIQDPMPPPPSRSAIRRQRQNATHGQRSQTPLAASVVSASPSGTRKYSFPYLERADIRQAQVLARKIGVKIPKALIAKIKNQDDPKFLKSLSYSLEHDGAKLVEEVFKLNISSLVGVLMPKVHFAHSLLLLLVGCYSRIYTSLSWCFLFEEVNSAVAKPCAAAVVAAHSTANPIITPCLLALPASGDGIARWHVLAMGTKVRQTVR